MADVAVVNASPLIFFSRSRHLELLRAFGDELWVPQPVADEIAARGRDDITAQAIKRSTWLVAKPSPPIPVSIIEWRLGAGESSVLALARQHGIEAIIDDLAGRKCAAALGVPVRGTLGIVLVAKQRGLIAEARPVIDDMLNEGLYLATKVIVRALQRVGE